MMEISGSYNNSLEEGNATFHTCFNETLIDEECGSPNTSQIKAELWEVALSEKLWKFVPPVLLVVGLTGNALVLAVLSVMKFYKHVALFFFFIMAISDSAVLVVVLLRYWILYTFDVDMRTLSEAGCKIILFLTYFTMQLSSWTLAAVTVERYIVIRYSLRSRQLVTMKRAYIAMLLIAYCLAFVDGYLLFTQRREGDSCGSFEGDDIYFFDENVFIWIDISVLCVIPFCVMFCCNIVIVREVKANVARHDILRPSDAPGKASRKVSSITLMLLAVNLYFLVTTIPISIYFILDTFLSSKIMNDTSIAAKMDLVWTLTYLLQFTNYSLNFYLYVARGKRFRAGFWKLFHRKYENDSGLDTRAQTVGDLNHTTPAWRRGSLTDNNILSLRRSTVIGNTISHPKDDTEFDQCNGRRGTVSTMNNVCNM